jgi:predicted membrane channel-forming protein YqfA (hemolysin III family)
MDDVINIFKRRDTKIVLSIVVIGIISVLYGFPNTEQYPILILLMPLGVLLYVTGLAVYFTEKEK